MKRKLRILIKAFGALISFIGLMSLLLSLVGTFLPVYVVDGFGISLYGIAFSAWDCGEMICSFHWILWLPLGLYFLSIALYLKGFSYSFRNRFYEGGTYYLVSGAALLISSTFFSFSHRIAQTSYAYSFGYFLMVIPAFLSALASSLLASSLFVFPPLEENDVVKEEMSYDPVILNDGRNSKKRHKKRAS